MLRRSAALLTAALSVACSSADEPTPTPETACVAPLEPGDPDGHPDPFGAKAAGEARAGRITDALDIPQPAHGRQRIEAGDFVLVNDKIAVVIENAGDSDGYSRYGGEILAVDKVGDDGRPLGMSRHLESLLTLGSQIVKPDSVTVLSDGSDGQAAVVRALGPLDAVPILSGALSTVLSSEYQFQTAYDYVLEPGAEKLLLRISVVNDSDRRIDFGAERAGSDMLMVLLHYNHNQPFTPELAYDQPSGSHTWVGFDGGPWGFAWRSVNGNLDFVIDEAGSKVFFSRGFIAESCSVATFDHAELIAGGPYFDGIAEAMRRVDDDVPWRTITGTVRDASGNPLEHAWIHELDEDDVYLSRVRTGADGTFTIHAPPAEAVMLIAQKRGYGPLDGVDVAADQANIDLAFAPHATLAVTATALSSGTALPVRIQVIPTAGIEPTPAAWGVLDEINGRLYQHFTMDGTASLPVPPGEYRVIVSHGYEWELHDETVTLAAGETVQVAAALEHSVDSTGVMCADFHIHSYMSADSNDPVQDKVMSAVADGLDIPVSSEHEWVVDFGPVVEQLGVSDWAFGMASEELTTFEWGHFGVVPLSPKPGQLNNGAMDWVGKTPAEVFAETHAQPDEPALIVNHPSGGGFAAYFSAMRFDRASATGVDPLYSDDFDAVEVFNDSDFERNRDASVADWFALLEHDWKIAAVGSSDSHHIRSSPVGYPRTCLYFGHDDPHQLTPPIVRDAMVAGSSVVSAGLMMTVAGPGGERPGQTVTGAGATVELTVTVQAPSWIGAETLETIVNAETVSVEPLQPAGTGTANRWVNVVNVPVDSSRARNWVVFHAKGEADLAPLHPGRHPFAVSNPIYLE